MKNNNDYYVGLDIGTNSVGWAVTNTNYKLKKYNNKFMQGVRMFDAMETAESRRMHRGARRRLNRRKDRLNQLKNYFYDEIVLLDEEFFTRMEEGFLQSEERTVKRNHTLFDDEEYTDKIYYEEFKTIYHLRHHLMYSSEKEDIRHIYLALHHIMKYRGHFLFSGSLSMDDNIIELLNTLNQLSNNMFNKEIFTLNDKNKLDDFLKVLQNQKLNKTNKTKALKEFANKEISKDEKHFEEIFKMLTARKTNLHNLFIHQEFEDKISIQLDDASIDENIMNLTELDEESLQMVNTIKAIYDWAILQNTLKGENSISRAMILSYKKHGKELEKLKEIISDIGAKEYKEFFHNEKKKGTYAYYVKHGSSIEDLYRRIKSLLKDAPDKYSNDVNEIMLAIENKAYLLKQRVSTNGIIPHQLHLYEMELILNNASKNYDFLNKVDETNLSIKEQIESIFKFRIPYYVGPLNDYHKEDGFAWVVRKQRGKVYPWNFEEMIDVEETAEEFIRRMTNKCSYLYNEDVLPRSSMLYQKFTVLNEINNIKLNGQSISVDMKQKLYEDLFIKTHINVNKNMISRWVKNNYPEYLEQSIEVTGIDDTIKSKLTSYHSFNNLFENNMPKEDVLENIILWSTLFSDEKTMLINKIDKEYPNMFNKDDLRKIEKLVFTGWGRLSKEMLENLLDETETTEPSSIIQSLYETNNNLMELLSSKYTYVKQITKINEKNVKKNSHTTYDLLEKLNLPPNIKRSVWQTIRITEELKKISKKDPTRIFIEMPRAKANTGRTSARKQQLLAFYKSLDKDDSLIQELTNNLNAETDDNLRRKKVYLYYKQLGRCMYSGERIHFKDLMDNTIYDIDHIYPRSKTADDSFKNLALVTKKMNQIKGDTFPLDASWREKMTPFWKHLVSNGLIEKETFFRLTRKDKLTIDELSNFVARQIVETQQSTKATFHLLGQLYPNTDIISVKARHINKFRHDNDFIKLRSLNDLHHAKDAYLSIVVGNVYYERFTKDPRNFIKNAKFREYNLNNVIDTRNEGNHVFSKSTGEQVWRSGPEGSIKTVHRAMNNNAVLTTYMIQDKSGELFDQMIVPKSENKVSIKAGLPSEKYGGYNKARYAYYALIDRDQGRKRIRTLEPVHLYLKDTIKNEQDLKEYLESMYGYKNVEIIKPHIPSVNTLLEYDGGRHRITGVTGNKCVMRNETQPFFNEKFEEIWKMIENIQEFERNDLLNKLDKTQLDYLFDEIHRKMKYKQYSKRLSIFDTILQKNKSTLEVISKDEYVELLWQLIKLLQSTRESSNLKLIGGSQSSGINVLGRNLSNKESMHLVHQSVTGLYETKEDLLAK